MQNSDKVAQALKLREQQKLIANIRRAYENLMNQVQQVEEITDNQLNALYTSMTSQERQEYMKYAYPESWERLR